MKAIQIEQFCLRKGDFCLTDVDLEIYPHEIFILLGKTGSGKTLLLESIAGFYRGDSGAILENGVPVYSIPTEERKIGFVYQDYGLFPHMSVYDNISYGLKMRKKNRLEIREKVSRIAGELSIEHILRQYPGTLSGGERQRTALARALVLSPDILLLDEPFAALDPVTKKMIYREIRKIHKEYDCTVIFVTHSFEEARIFGTRVGIMENGRLKAVRSREDLFFTV